ncbi:hypothetical protein PHLH6_17990 [Pseudomonas sp. Seg1]|uniref:hypothetical protein n=1 Tax=Pseudomonas sp. Seg1 TaxID=2678259 RepID=UPI001BB2F1DE|nr:hypothetical protein [Pseudomonas sp. Seg1]BBP69795.1 hypothetical protein PHLH6_17990 [Pseudomonas sp. Seg1]
MAKSPKKIPKSSAGDASTPTTRTGVDLPSGHRFPDLHLPDGDPTPGHSARQSQIPVVEQPNVIVSNLPGHSIDTYGFARSEIAWPQSRYNELVALGADTGLFRGPDLRTYAEIGNEGRFLVELNERGVYHVPLSFAPGVPGPILTKVEGQPRWRIERPGWQSSPTAAASITPKPPTYLAPHLAAALTKADLSSDGVRYDKHKKTYVDTADGTVMVRKNNDGAYRETSASELSPSGPELEAVAGTKLWRRKALDTAEPTRTADEPTPGPSKRARLDDPQEPEAPTAANSAIMAEQTPYFWLPWGHLHQPTTGESIQLGWLHYSIVPVGSAPHRLPKVYYLQHPEFAPTHFAGFERMLQTAPELQPVATFRIGTEPGEVRPGKRLFEKPLTQSVAETFIDFSNFTARAVARRLFELSDDSPTVTGTGLSNIQNVLSQWNQKPFPTTPAFADPLNMLPVANSIEVSGKKVIPLHPQVEGDLQRLMFDPQHFPFEWKNYKKEPTDLNLRRLVGALLIRSSYDVFPLTHDHRKPTLVFRRSNHDEVFFLKLGTVEHIGLSHTPGNELADPGLSARIGSEAYTALSTAAVKGKVVWLIGGVMKVESNPEAVFILRER